MLMMPERKKAVTVIVGSLGEGAVGPEQGEDDYSFAKKMCALKLMKAMKEENVGEFAEYMSEFISMCQHNSDDESEMEY